MLCTVDSDPSRSVYHVGHPWTSWAAVLAGVTTTIAVQIGLTELCIASGLALYQPAAPGASTAALAVGTVGAVLVCALVSVFLGGWVAGRMKRHDSPVEAAVHGTLVWAVGSIAALLLTTISVGILAGGAFSLLGFGISGVAKGIEVAVPAAVQAVAPWDGIKKDLTDALDRQDAASTTPLADNRFADRSRLMQLLAHAFSAEAKDMSDADQEELKNLIGVQLGISPEAAGTAYAQWQRVWAEGMSRYEAALADAKRAAQDAAAAAAKRTAQAAIAAFFAMVVGLCAAIAGALCGSACATRCIMSRTPVSVVGQTP